MKIDFYCRKVTSVSLLILFILTGFNVSQLMAVDPFETAIRCPEWKAKQISRTRSNALSLPSQIDYFRKEFRNRDDASSAVLHLSADFLYKVYVNGQFLGDGPPRTSIGASPYYVSYEIGSLMKPGANVLALEVFARAPHNVFNGGDVQTAMTQIFALGKIPEAKLPTVSAQLEFRNLKAEVIGSIITDNTWRALPSAWFPITNATSPGYSIPEVFDARKEPEGWKLPGFNDAKWEPVNVSESPSFEASVIPHFIRTERLPSGVISTGEISKISSTQPWIPAGVLMSTEIPKPSKFTRIENANGLLQKNGGAAIVYNQVNMNDPVSYYDYFEKNKDLPLIREATMIIDFGEIMNAFVSIDIEGEVGSAVDIGWGQLLLDGRVPTWPFQYWRPGFLQHNASRYYLKNGRQTWETFHWQNFRYLQLTFRDPRGVVKLHRVTAIQSEQPLVRQGSFACSDPLLDKLFLSTEKTLRATSYDFFMDNTIREKIPWGGDVAEGAVLSCLPVFGDVPMLRYYFDLFAKSQTLIGTGRIPAAATADNPGNHFIHPVRTAIIMAEYGFWCKDEKHYREVVIPMLKKFIAYLKGRTDNQGLISVGQGESTWVDHVRGVRTTDKSTNSNLLYALLLERAASIMKAYGEKSLSVEYAAKAAQVKESVKKAFLDESKGLFVDGLKEGQPCGSISQHPNYLALCAGLVGKEKEDKFLKLVEDSGYVNHLVRYGPPFLYWPPAALFKIGKGRIALDLIRKKYSLFFRDSCEVFKENWAWGQLGNTWEAASVSQAQDGAGSPAWFLLTEVLGVKPLSAGFSEFEIAPAPCDLEWARGIVPSPKGNIPVAWEKKGDTFLLEVTVPAGSKAKVRFPGKEKAVTLKPGSHKISVKL